MEYEENAERKLYLETTGKIVLNACPGSGKTTSIAKKIVTLLDDWSTKENSYSGIACITFTNNATDEILTKIRNFKGRSLDYPHSVCTINSFFNQYILFPNINKFLGTNLNYRVLDNSFEFDNLIKRRHGLRIFRKFKSGILYSIPPSSVEYSITGDLYSSNRKEVNKDYFETIKAIQFFKEGILKSSDTVFLSLEILKKNPRIAKILVNRFSHLLIDEAQDCNDFHYAIFDLLVDAGLRNIEFIGDPYQGIYDFNMGNPVELLKRFNDTTNWVPLNFDNCRRSTQKIIDTYKVFLPATSTIVSTSNIEPESDVVIVQYDESGIDKLKDFFNQVSKGLTSKRILVRGDTGLKNFGAKIDHSNNPWKNEYVSNIIQAKKYFDQRNVKKSVDLFRRTFIDITCESLNYSEKQNKLEEIIKNSLFNSKILKFIRSIPEFTLTVKDWTEQLETSLNSCFNGGGFKFEIKDGGTYKNAKAKNVIDFFSDSQPNIIDVTTIHQAKGMTFEAVMLVLSENSSGQNISASDIQIPVTFPNEKQRMIYVAMSRASHLLMIAVPNTIDISKHPILKEYASLKS